MWVTSIFFTEMQIGRLRQLFNISTVVFRGCIQRRNWPLRPISGAESPLERDALFDNKHNDRKTMSAMNRLCHPRNGRFTAALWTLTCFSWLRDHHDDHSEEAHPVIYLDYQKKISDEFLLMSSSAFLYRSISIRVIKKRHGDFVNLFYWVFNWKKILICIIRHRS